MQTAAVNQQRSNSSTKPSQFNGTTQKNRWCWLDKFIAYCRRASKNLTDDNAVLENCVLSIDGPAKTRFMLLPPDQRDTLAHLQDVFLRWHYNS